jgi:hypothetical protein
MTEPAPPLDVRGDPRMHARRYGFGPDELAKIIEQVSWESS